jgi:hypothetical protein
MQRLLRPGSDVMHGLPPGLGAERHVPAVPRRPVLRLGVEAVPRVLQGLRGLRRAAEHRLRYMPEPLLGTGIYLT